MTHSPLASPSATIALLQRHGLYTKKSLGQHFLIDDNVIGRIIDLAAPRESDVVLEVGPGIGTLTVALCETAAAVVAVERDRTLLPALAEATSDCAHLTVLTADAVNLPVDDLSRPYGAPTSLVSNLPYGVAATIVLRLFQELGSLTTATVMVQAEVAARMAARPGSKDYGAYTVKLQLLAAPGGSFTVSRNSFLPPPRVDSAVVRLDRRTEQQDPRVVVEASCVADAAFAQRRKTLRNSLAASLGTSMSEIDAALESAQVDGGIRAEQLAPDRFVAIAEALRPRA